MKRILHAVEAWMDDFKIKNKFYILYILCVLVPLIVILYLLPQHTDILHEQLALASFTFDLRDLLVLALFAIASFTDFLDGHIARKHSLITSFGKFVDPIADKLLVDSLLILFAADQRISVAAVILMIARDIIVDGLRMNAASAGKVVAAGYAGKVKTVLQMFMIIIELLGIPGADILLWAAVAASLYSGVRYFIQLKDIVMETM